MRKNILLTTALVGVAFAFPAMANEAENPPADETITHEAIYTNETGTTVADGTVFEGLGNTTEVERAGAVTVDTQGSIVIGNNVKFNKNTSNWSGGAMKALSGFEIGNNVTFEGNTSEKGGGAYRVNGEKLDRLGFEFGAKVATEVSDNLEISAGWESRFREDYQDHTAMLNAKYSF